MPAASRKEGDALAVGPAFAIGALALGVMDGVVGLGDDAVAGATFAGASAPITPLPAAM
jgi:hypothetical protein